MAHLKRDRTTVIFPSSQPSSESPSRKARTEQDLWYKGERGECRVKTGVLGSKFHGPVFQATYLGVTPAPEPAPVLSAWLSVVPLLVVTGEDHLGSSANSRSPGQRSQAPMGPRVSTSRSPGDSNGHPRMRKVEFSVPRGRF